MLWLFDCRDKGVVHNDDNPNAASGLESRIDNRTNCITAPGIYLLGITRYNRYTVDSRGQPIWTPSTSFRLVRCHDQDARRAFSLRPGSATPFHPQTE